jgi:hypothetical protein
VFQFDEPFGSTIFCDDIRNEIGGKNSYIGVYSGSMGIASFPAQVAKFGIVSTIYEPRAMAEVRNWPIVVNLYLPGDDPSQPSAVANLPPLTKEILQALAGSLPDDEEVPPLAVMNVAFALSPMILRGPGRIKVRAKYREGVIIKLGSCRVEPAPQIAPAP